jgi:primosomal replication protein N
VTRTLLALELGAASLYAGFLAGSRNGRGLRFHITSVEPAG